MRPTRSKRAQAIRHVGLLASPLLLTLLLVAVSSLISINCASLRYGRIQNYPSRGALASPTYQARRIQSSLDSNGEELSSLLGNDEYNRYLLAAAALVSAEEPQLKQREYYAIGDEDIDNLERQQAVLQKSLADEANNRYSLNSFLSQLSSSPNHANPNSVDEKYSIKSNENYNNIVTPNGGDDNYVSNSDLKFARSLSGVRISPSADLTNSDLVINNDNLLINNQQQSPFASDQTEPLESIEPLDVESSANLELINKSNRGKPVVSTLVEDDPKSSFSSKDHNGNKDKNLDELAVPNGSIGRVIERESDRTNKEAAPSWQLFLSRIYESVFGRPAGLGNPQSSLATPQPTTTTPKTNKHNQNEKHTKPSEVSSELNTIHSNQHDSTMGPAITTKSKKDLATPSAHSDKTHLYKPGREEADNQDKKLTSVTSESEEQHEDKKVSTSTKRTSPKMADVVEKVIQQNKHKHIDDNKRSQSTDDHKLASSPSLPGFDQQTYDEGEKISSMRKSTLVLPLEDLDSDEKIEQFLERQQQQQQSTPALYATGAIYPLKTSQTAGAPASGSPMATFWGPSGNNNNNLDLGSYKSFTRGYHRGEPIFGFAPQVVSTQPSGFAYRPHGNDFYFLIMVGAFCCMAIAMVLVAGMFAYRIQQNRKSPTEMDYPTYGVVGPNSIAGGKLGASGASFVGGYFASNNAQAFGKGFTMHGKGCSNADLSSNNNNCGGGIGGAGTNIINSKNSAIGGSSDNGFYSPNDSGVASSITSGGQANANNSSSAGDAGKTLGMSGGASKRSPSDARPPTFMASQQNAARIYHYQHQKQQMISSERNSSGRHTSASDLDSEEENEDGNYTVYECPGLASAHDMEIRNPLFNDDRSP